MLFLNFGKWTSKHGRIFLVLALLPAGLEVDAIDQSHI